MELRGRPMTDLRGLVLTMFDPEHSGSRIAIPLTGSIGQDGFYVVGNVTGAGFTFIHPFAYLLIPPLRVTAITAIIEQFIFAFFVLLY